MCGFAVTVYLSLTPVCDLDKKIQADFLVNCWGDVMSLDWVIKIQADFLVNCWGDVMSLDWVIERAG